MIQKLLTLVTLASALSVSALAQNDGVVAELTKEETAKAAELHKRLVAAQAEWDSFKTDIFEKYGPILAKGLPMDKLLARSTPDGRTSIHMPIYWQKEELVFSRDFRFVLPRVQKPENRR